MKKQSRFTNESKEVKSTPIKSTINSRLIREYENWLKNVEVDATPELKLEYLISHIKHHIKILTSLNLASIPMSDIDYDELLANYTISDMETIYKKDVPLVDQDYFKVFEEELRIYNVYIKQRKTRESFDPRLVALLKTVEKGNNHIKWMWNKTNVTELKLIQQTLFPHLFNNNTLKKIYDAYLPIEDDISKSPNSNESK